MKPTSPAATRPWPWRRVRTAGRYDFYGFQQAVQRAWAVDGECLVRFVLNPGQRVPLQLQLLGAEYLDNSRIDQHTLNGITYDDAGRRAAYWLFSKYPAAPAPTYVSVRVSADQVMHLHDAIQPGAERGVSWLSPALLPLKELQEYIEAALVKAKVSSLYCGFVTTQDGSNPLNSDPNSVPTLEPGSMVRLKAGETVEWSNPVDPGVMFEPFVRAQLRAIASALNLPYELLSGDVSQVTFASGRHSLLEFRRHLESLQHHLMVHQFCRVVLNQWARLAVAVGVLPGNAGDYGARWIAPLPEALDPKAEMLAVVHRVRAGFMSRSEAVALTGLDAEELDAQIATDNARADRLGLVLDSDPRKTTVQGQEQGTGGIQSEPTQSN